MKPSFRLPVTLLFILSPLLTSAQIITSDPDLSTSGQALTIYYDATLGTAGLEDFTGDVYAHTGVITDQSTDMGDWKYVKTAWGTNTAETKLTLESANLYSLEIGPSIREYYGVPANESITHLAFVFRSADSSKEGKDDGGSDIFVVVYEEGLSVAIINPDRNSIVDPGTSLAFEASASQVANLVLYLNN
ncbi:MAG: Por secretion system protein, partial [Bacteroidetes bacterium]